MNTSKKNFNEISAMVTKLNDHLDETAIFTVVLH